jgi:hypothetical protein
MPHCRMVSWLPVQDIQDIQDKLKIMNPVFIPLSPID